MLDRSLEEQGEWPLTLTPGVFRLSKYALILLAALCLPARAQGNFLSLNLNQNQVVGGATLGGTVAISQPAPPGGVLVTLWSGDDVRVPGQVLIPAGSTYTGFSIATSPTSQPLYVRILASTNTARQQTFLQVMPGGATAPTASQPRQTGLQLYKQYPMVGPVYGTAVPYYYGWGAPEPWARPTNFDSDGFPMMHTSEDM